MSQTSTGSTQALRASSVTSIRRWLGWCGVLLCIGLLLGRSETSVAETADIAYAKGVLAYSTQNWRGLRYRDTGYHEKVLKNQRSCIFWKVSKPQNIQEPATC